jgi:hypothetical protein
MENQDPQKDIDHENNQTLDSEVEDCCCCCQSEEECSMEEG